jgi:hypothetical protein
MIAIKETSPGIFEPVDGNPVLLSLDGKVKAPLGTILAPSWTAEDRAKFGVHVVDPFRAPDGKQAIGPATYAKIDGVVVEVREIEDVPTQAPELTTEEKIAKMAAAFGLTVDGLRAAIVETVKAK